MGLRFQTNYPCLVNQVINQYKQKMPVDLKSTMELEFLLWAGRPGSIAPEGSSRCSTLECYRQMDHRGSSTGHCEKQRALHFYGFMALLYAVSE